MSEWKILHRANIEFNQIIDFDDMLILRGTHRLHVFKDGKLHDFSEIFTGKTPLLPLKIDRDREILVIVCEDDVFAVKTGSAECDVLFEG